MANGIDRLEKLFSKRRAASARSPAGINRSNSLVAPSTFPCTEISPFPQPSFIRPTFAKMIARDEFETTKSAGRAHSVPDNSSRTTIMSSSPDATSFSIDSTRSLPARATNRPSSPLDKRDLSLASLRNFQFRERSGSQLDARPVSPTSRPRKDQLPRLRLRLFKLQDPEPISIQPLDDTPPPSDQDEDLSRALLATSSVSPALTNAPVLGPAVNLTPGPSPELFAVRDTSFSSSREDYETTLMPLLKRDSVGHPPCWMPSPRKVVVPRKAAPQTHPILTEPNFGDFLSLSDDDIAETRPPTPGQTQTPSPTREPPPSAFEATPMQTTSSTSSFRSFRACAAPSTPPPFEAPQVPSSLPASSIISTPPMSRRLLQRTSTSSAAAATQGATIAAFHAARIAHRHNFDLVYVVNLWPKGMSPTEGESPWDPDSPPTTPTQASPFGQCSSGTGFIRDSGSFANMSQCSDLHGRFLAAYGLATVKPPIQLSGTTHREVLNAEDWHQFEFPGLDKAESAMAYGCSFYTGHASPAPVSRRASDSGWDADGEESDEARGGSTPKPKQCNDSAPSQSPLSNNRGIAFVGLRKGYTNADTETQGPDLKALREDVETLVEFILDFHTMQRRREQLAALRTTYDIKDPLDTSAVNPNLSFVRT